LNEELVFGGIAMKITIFGTGYVGLVAAACLADAGHQVMCVDAIKSKIEDLKSGKIPFYEPGLDILVSRNIMQERLIFTFDAAAGVKHGRILFISVGTPATEDGTADVRHVLDVAQLIGEHMDDYKVVVVKSTVPVGTTHNVRSKIDEALHRRGCPDLPFGVCSNPEFLKEGSAVQDFTKSARIVLGTDSERVREFMCECYAPYIRKLDKIIFMDILSAELTKYAANAMLSAKISFINEIANLAERLGADVEQVRKGIGSDPRIGYEFIYPGCGYGGSCFPKDLRALIRTAEQVKHEPALFRAVEEVNNRQKRVLFEKLRKALGENLSGKTIAVWGLAFKPNTSDMREAPSRMLLEALWKAGAHVQAYDPAAIKEAEYIYGKRDDFRLVNTREAAVTAADALVICTEWQEFRAVDLEWLRSQLSQSVVVDGRNLFDPHEMKQAGFRYYAVGRGENC